MNDILEHLLELYGVDYKFIRQIASGRRYFAVELVNGNIGVCATLGDRLPDQLPQWLNPDLIRHRIILTAYFNALVNYRSENIIETGDITEVVDFSKYRNIHVVGKFQPLFEKFKAKGINFTFSDLRAIDDPQNQIDRQKDLIQQADCLVISATTIYNNTFNQIVQGSPKADRYLLGPSAIMSPVLCQWGIKASFGTRFKPYDSRVLGLIAQDYGTRYFLKRGQKVGLLCESITAQ